MFQCEFFRNFAIWGFLDTAPFRKRSQLAVNEEVQRKLKNVAFDTAGGCVLLCIQYTVPRGGSSKLMKTNLLLLLLLAVTGCVGFESDYEYKERFDYMHLLSSDARVTAICAHKPDGNIGVLGDSHRLDIYVNNARNITLPDGRVGTRPGNTYTPDELKVIEDVAAELSKKMGVRRRVYIYDVTGDRKWRVDDRRDDPIKEATIRPR